MTILMGIIGPYISFWREYCIGIERSHKDPADPSTRSDEDCQIPVILGTIIAYYNDFNVID
jgi:hypothetical protein